MTVEHPLPPALGNYAAGDRFWDREREVGDIVAYLVDGQSVVLTFADATALADDLVEDIDQRPATLRHVLEILEHDAYLGRGPDGWRYRSRVVRDWWRQGNELGFVPPERRPPRR